MFSAGCVPCAASLTGVILTKRSKLRFHQVKPSTSIERVFSSRIPNDADT